MFMWCVCVLIVVFMLVVVWCVYVVFVLVVVWCVYVVFVMVFMSGCGKVCRVL